MTMTSGTERADVDGGADPDGTRPAGTRPAAARPLWRNSDEPAWPREDECEVHTEYGVESGRFSYRGLIVVLLVILGLVLFGMVWAGVSGASAPGGCGGG